MSGSTARTGHSNTIKLVIVGDGAVGKTSLLQRYANDKFNPEHEPTIFENTWIDRVIDGQRCELELWDNAGQEDFDKLRLLSYQDTDCFLVAFSVHSEQALKNVLGKWVPEIEEHSHGVPKLLVCTKSDLRDCAGLQLTSAEQGERLAKEIGASAYMECSAKLNVGCTDVFEQAVREAIAWRKAQQETKSAKSARSRASKTLPSTCCSIC